MTMRNNKKNPYTEPTVPFYASGLLFHSNYQHIKILGSSPLGFPNKVTLPSVSVRSNKWEETLTEGFKAITGFAPLELELAYETYNSARKVLHRTYLIRRFDIGVSSDGPWTLEGKTGFINWVTRKELISVDTCEDAEYHKRMFEYMDSFSSFFGD